MLNYIHSVNIRKIVVKIQKIKCLMMHFDPETRVFVLSNWHKIQLCDKFSSVIFICLTPFSQLQFGLIGCMILIKKYLSLTTAAMRMGERHFYSDHVHGFWERKNASLGNSILNHLGHVSLASWIFSKSLPVVGVLEIWKSRKY